MGGLGDLGSERMGGEKEKGGGRKEERNQRLILPSARFSLWLALVVDALQGDV